MERVIKTICLSIILVLLTGMLACRKDKPTPCSNDSECFEFDWGNQSPAYTWFSNERFQFKTPYFNPNNGKEFVYNFIDFELNKYTLMKYNLVTGEKTELLENIRVITQPSWSTKGWIAFDNLYGTSSHQISVIKDEGDSLRIFSSFVYNYYPAWANNGTTLYWHHSPTQGRPAFLFKQDLSYLSPDTILKDGDLYGGVSMFNSINRNDKLVSQTLINNTQHLAITNLTTINFSSLISLADSDLPSLQGLTTNEKFVYFSALSDNNSGLYQININDLSKKKIMTFCDSKNYKYISISPDGTKLIGERVDRYLKKDSDGNPTGQIIENSSIYIIDLQTLKETKINLE